MPDENTILEIGWRDRRIAELEAALRTIADGEPPEEEIECGTVDAWMREVARKALAN